MRGRKMTRDKEKTKEEREGGESEERGKAFFLSSLIPCNVSSLSKGSS